MLRIGMPSVIVGNVKEISMAPFPKIEEISIRLDIDTDITPVAQRPRLIPITLQRPTELRLEELLRQDIIEERKGLVIYTGHRFEGNRQNAAVRRDTTCQSGHSSGTVSNADVRRFVGEIEWSEVLLKDRFEALRTIKLSFMNRPVISPRL